MNTHQNDATEIGELKFWLGLSVGINLVCHPMEKKKPMSVILPTNQLRNRRLPSDNMVVRAENMVQRPLNYALVDEVDRPDWWGPYTLIVSGANAVETSQLSTTWQTTM